MKKLSRVERALVAGLSVATVAAVGEAVLKSSDHAEAQAKTPAVVPVSTLKSQLHDLGVTFQKVKAYKDASGVELVAEVNGETGSKGDDVKTGKQISDTTIHLSQFALQRLAQVSAGEGTGEKSIVGPDGVQEYDIQFSAQKDGGTTDSVEVPVVPNQHVADMLNGALPPVHNK